MSRRCNLCGADALERVYTLDARAVTSVRGAGAQESGVWFCHACGHTLTEPQTDIDTFYADNYNLLTGSEEEDQLLNIVDDKKIFRSDFQAHTLSQAVTLQDGMRVLDYGGAKGATLKKLLATRGIEPFIFDVSNTYRSFWNDAIPEQNQAVRAIPAAWHGTMDVVYSFFCLEHVADPAAAFAAQFALLKEGGICYTVVPNVYTNMADLLVIDHVNHFAACSLRYALAQAGFSAITIEGNTQPGWWMVRATRAATAGEAQLPAPAEVCAAHEDIRRIADYWAHVTQRLADYIPRLDARIAVYGAGFYGTYAALHLNPNVPVECFVDQNPFLHGTTQLGKPVLAPADLPAHISTLLIALNPAHARRTMAAMQFIRDKPLELEFIFEGNV